MSKRYARLMNVGDGKVQKRYIDKYDNVCEINAGTKGWVVFWENGGADYLNRKDTTENNFKMAMKVATDVLGELKECLF